MKTAALLSLALALAACPRRSPPVSDSVPAPNPHPDLALKPAEFAAKYFPRESRERRELSDRAKELDLKGRAARFDKTDPEGREKAAMYWAEASVLSEAAAELHCKLVKLVADKRRELDDQGAAAVKR